jgi:acyl-coenzyme A synthetase/AMP-(fatty) acid ligase
MYFKQIESLGMTLPILNIDTIDFENGLIKEEFLLNRLSKLIDTDPYCIINTSGSTGTPKGVVLNHKSFVDFIEWSVDTFKFSEDEIIGSLSPLVFDIYSYELCMLMSKGSTIVLIPDSLAAFPIKILEILVKEKITFLFWVPTIMVNIANMGLLEKIHLPSLKTVWFAGEVFPTKQFNYWKNNLKDCLFANLYGPIEITLDCTYFIIDRDIPDDEPLPIGIACRNTDILILNEEDKLVEKGEEGELCVRGTSLAMGYFNNPEKTALAFVQNPLNNSYPEIIYRTGDVVLVNERDEIVFKGRKDSLVKHLGYRIELGEIEHVIVNTLKIAKNGCVVYNSIKKEITLFYEASNEISVAEFRKELTKSLPKYMIPTVYIFMQELPRNTNGKIDRLYLKNIVN